MADVLEYPVEPCPFCGIADVYAFPESRELPRITSNSKSYAKSTSALSPSRDRSTSQVRTVVEATDEQEQEHDQSSESSEEYGANLERCIPDEKEADPGRTQPESFVVLRSRNVLAFLDIAPMTRGHLLVTARRHAVKVADLSTAESQAIGFWLPLLARTVTKVTGVSDYNIVQNNGARAAQVVPHVHFHIIPRPESMPQLKSKSWTMFGRGQREELDEEEGGGLAGRMRGVLREEVRRVGGEGKGAKL